MVAGERPESVAQPAHFTVYMRHFTLTLTLPDTPNLCPHLTDISKLHKQFLQHTHTHHVCLSFCTWVFRVCRGNEFRVVHEYGGVDAWKRCEWRMERV